MKTTELNTNTGEKQNSQNEHLKQCLEANPDGADFAMLTEGEKHEFEIPPKNLQPGVRLFSSVP